MLATVVLLLLCVLIAIAGIPLILKLVPRNEYFGVLTEKALSAEDIWYEVNRFGGWALVVSAVCTVLAVVVWSNTVLRPFWRQILVFVASLAMAAGATFWYERRAGQRRKARSRRPRT
jgi:uncharacterized membrane protein